ncbi:gliding motility-associated C-terminal domain-containing protein [Flavobacterium circumlabens]|uniref:Gliding motility-associated C-terminal domain-containing protein n=1 Tax=Flavobacterium circumlabens TaxID=2133765 RepID=A0A4Y7UHT1_9FLAO|nr:T9SS type B sorting domain-containing protein [Flavobacterium circumlabens]TCN60889.1 gliding motility-associated-like protein [Flavobacterium circumlabens]TEB46010.1 gliding motility-associated C-terminal domain-containing protein [Flavobacterium circumlabens]
MLKKLLFLFSFFFSHFLFSQCPSGNIAFIQQSDVNNFVSSYPNCEVISGNLYISGDVSDISKLTSIKSIEGDLMVNSYKITDVSNFLDLEFVGGNLIITNTLIKNLIGFSKIKSINGSLNIYQNSRNPLETINAFENLEIIKGDFQIYEPSLQTITGFDKLIEITSNLILSDNSRLTQVPSFNSLKIIGGDLSITNTYASVLENINSFNTLETIGNDFKIASPSLVSIDGFKNLKKINRFFQISPSGFRSPILKTIPDFENLEIIGGGFEITETEIIKLPGFNKLKSIGGWFMIRHNSSLESIEGMNNLKSIAGVIDIGINEKLENIKGLKNLAESGALLIGGNPSLKTLEGLQSLIRVGEYYSSNDVSIKINYNLSLTDCSAICNLLSSPLKNGLTEIMGNPSKCSNKSEVEQECIPDFDRDGILDDVDLDDDNDGILDIVENNGIQNRDSDGDGFSDLRDLDSDNDGCFDVIEAGFEDNDGDGFLGNLPYSVDANGLVTSVVNGYTTPLDDNNDGVFDFQITNILSAGKNGLLHICTSESPVDLFNYLTETPNRGGIWNPVLPTGNGIFNPATDAPGVYTYIVTNGRCGTKSSQVEVFTGLLPNTGEDNHLSICINSGAVDLFTVLKGRPDAGGIWTPTLSSGTGVFDPKKDSAGVYKYTLTNQSCPSDTSEITVNIEKLPNAGKNNQLSVCVNNSPIDLFTILKGLPDSGGTWNPVLSSGTGVFDPKKDIPGIYVYTVSNEKCSNVSAEIEINITPYLSAGENGTLAICKDSQPIDLFNSLKGSPNNSGTWSPTLSSGNGIFDPNKDAEGIYKYTITNGICENSIAEVNVNIFKIQNAGENSSVSICINSNSIDLFDKLKGNPDRGGFWIPNLSGVDGLFNPLQDKAGTYVYKIDNGNCGTDSAEITVTIKTVSNISNYQIKTNNFNDNSSLEIIINTGLQYEYSLDGSSYQKENIFNNLSGGDYTVFVRELNGCGFLEEKISLLNYPKFFTPNGDSYNDTWQLLGSTEKDYSIFIFNRYGKLLKELTKNHPSWDGMYNSIPQLSDDYWFQIKFSDGQIQKGHFSLKR